MRSSDPDGDPITYYWQFLSLPSASHAVLDYFQTPTPSFIADVNGQYIVSLTVSDGMLSSLPDNVAIISASPNAPPVANAGPDQYTAPNTLVHLDGSSSYDPDNDPLMFTWRIASKPQGSASELNDAVPPNPTFLADLEGEYVIRLSVSDGQLESAPDTVVVSAGNLPPIANAGPDVEVRPNSSVWLDGSASLDPDGDPISYQWTVLSSPQGSNIFLYNPTEAYPCVEFDMPGQYIIQLVVSDGRLISTPDTVIITAKRQMVSVPDVVGYDLWAAEYTLRWLNNLLLGTVTRANSPTVPIDFVISQNPTAGTILEEGSRVNLVVSAGVTVPDVVGKIQSEAQASLVTAGLTIGTINTAFSDSVPAGTVISQTPTGGTAVNGGTPVSLVVSRGPRMTVPSVMGMPREEARAAIIAAGLTVGSISESYHPVVPAGRVLKQMPVGGTDAAQGSPVDLSVSSGQGGAALPPDPTAVAPRLDRTVATTLFDSTTFLYSGSNPVQVGVAPGTIELRRISVIRGTAKSGDDTPLPGVTVTILNHPEFGHTFTRDDGMFDIAVNGGGLLTIQYEKAGYPAVQRQVSTSWQKFEWAPDIVMIPYDSEVNVVNLSSPAPTQVARGSLVSDNDGSRQATVLFTQGTQANLVFADGSTRAISSLSVRATEYTVGAQGPSAMPAKLPPSSAYTYCVELSVDEAVLAGAVEVRFDRPVTFYVENFIGFPAGGIVPVGYYDRQKGVWVPSSNGKIIKVLGVSGGLVDLDVNGDGVADTGSALTALGITDAERERLSLLYPAGTSLWRVAVTHFSPWDYNMPPGLPPDAYFAPPPMMATPKEHPDVECGSVIDCQNQTLGESVHVAGTPLDLVYKSDRVIGHLAAYYYRMEIPVTGSVVPGSLKGVEMTIEVEGQRYRQIYAPSPAAGEELLRPNITYSFLWNGKDAYGRTVQGVRPVRVRIGYKYETAYSWPALSSPSFGLPGNPDWIYGGWIYKRSGATETFPVEWNIHRGLSQGLGGFDAKTQGFGGWTINANHVYHPGSGVLYEGNGKRRSASDIQQVITTVAGNGGFPYSWLVFDNTSALQARISAGPMSFGSDGNLYLTDSYNHIVRKITSDGVVTRVAGSGYGAGGHEGGYWGEGAGEGLPAINAPLNMPSDVAVGRDGSLYIADMGNHRVRRVGTDGIITTIAGVGRSVWNSQLWRWVTTGYGYSGDGGPAVDAMLHYPSSVAVGPDGSVYIYDDGNARIRRVGTDGIITTLAGTGQSGYSGDGGPATQAMITSTTISGLIGPGGIDVGMDGNLYITDRTMGRVRRISRNGIITTVAGGAGCYYAFSGDGGPATETCLDDPADVVVGTDGSLYIAEAGENRVRRVGPDGIISTIAGTGKGFNVNYYFSGDGGPGTQADLANPSGVAIGPDGLI
jgi:beta-lactam-binding protein with PASTA domain/sugar lactone lactonase YvrE